MQVAAASRAAASCWVLAATARPLHLLTASMVAAAAALGVALVAAVVVLPHLASSVVGSVCYLSSVDWASLCSLLAPLIELIFTNFAVTNFGLVECICNCGRMLDALRINFGIDANILDLQRVELRN